MNTVTGCQQTKTMHLTFIKPEFYLYIQFFIFLKSNLSLASVSARRCLNGNRKCGQIRLALVKQLLVVGVLSNENRD